MTEGEFWLSLKHRVSREMAGLSERELRFLWCDGFTPHEYLLNSQTPSITGLAWIASEKSSKQERWPFVLSLPKQFSERNEIDWHLLLPPDNVTCWLGVDADQKKLEVDLTAAVPDDPFVPRTTFIFYTRVGCHLCERLEALLAPLLAKQPGRFTLVHRDIEENADWHEQFWSRIPVLTVGDRVLLEGKPSEADVKRVMHELLSA